MTYDRSRNDEEEFGARILRYRPRTSATAPGHPPAQELSASDSKPDDFRHRMWVNLAGLTCAVLLTACGVWLASRMSELRQTQDCVLSGRRNCAPIAAVDRESVPLRQH